MPLIDRAFRPGRCNRFHWHLAPLRAETPHFQVGQASGENARRIGMPQKTQRVAF